MTHPDSQTLVPPPGNGHDHELTRRLRDDVARRLAREAAGPDGAQPLTPARRAELGRRLIAEALDDEAARALSDARAPLDAATERQVGQAVFDALFGLGGFQPFLDDPDVESVNANGCDEVFVQYAAGRRVRAAPIAGSDAELTDLIRAIATRAGNEERRFDRATPRVSVPLPGGGRLFAVMAVTGRPCVAIRRDRLASASLDGLTANGTLDGQLAAFLAAVVKARKNILVSGGTAVGKTTLLRALASAIPPRERLITIEDSLELCLDWDTDAHPDVVAMQSREANVEGEGEITLAELVRWALRMTPDRVIVGEVRGSEVVPMLNAMSQGNDGSMTTIHASSSRGAFMKVASYAAQSAEHLSLEDTNLLIAGAVHFAESYAFIHEELDVLEYRDVKVHLQELLVERSAGIARREKFDASEVRTLFKNGSPMLRVLALGLMEGDSSLADGATISAAIKDYRSKNEQYHGLRLAELCWHTLSKSDRQEIRTAVANITDIKPDSDRRPLADKVLSLPIS